jgi:hypothetical protein
MTPSTRAPRARASIKRRLALCLSACRLTACGLYAAAAIAEPSPTAAPLPLSLWIDATATAQASLGVVEVGVTPPAVKPPVVLSDTPRDEGHVLRQATASDGVHVCAVRASTSAPLSVAWGPLSAPQTTAVTLPPELLGSDLYAALVYGTRCYLGLSRARVIEVDFSASPAKVHVFEPPKDALGSEYKSVDVFIDAGDTLLAVDDIMTPFYTFVFDKDASGALTYRHMVSLGNLINGTYHWGLYHDGVVGLLSSINHRGGWGQSLTFYRASAFTSPPAREVKRLPALGHLGEHQARSPKPGDTNTEGLLGGSEWTPLLGAVIANKHLLIAAGARGVLVAPGSPPKGAGAVTVADVGGACLDIEVRGDQVWILRARGGVTEVAQVVWDVASARLVDAQVVQVSADAKSFL